MTPRGSLVCPLDGRGLLSIGESLVWYQSHHHSLFLDQSIADALGGDAWAVKRKAAFESSRALLLSLQAARGVTGEAEMLELASDVFCAMGHGRLTFELTRDGGIVRAEALHFGSSFAEKYGGFVKNRRVLDAFGAGFCAAAGTLAFPLANRPFDAAEISCVGRRDPYCAFSLARRPVEAPIASAVTRSDALAMPSRAASPPAGADIAHEKADVRALVDSTGGDESGIIRAFGVRAALVPVVYTNQITSETAQFIERRSPELIAVFTALAREAALMGAFHLLTGLLSALGAPASRGAVPADPRERLAWLLELANALGWGSLSVEEFVPGRTLVLKSRMTPELAYYVARRGDDLKARLAFMQGTALAMMYILHRVDFSEGPPRVTREVYNALFRSGTRFLVEETRSLLRGDDDSEVLVEAVAD